MKNPRLKIVLSILYVVLIVLLLLHMCKTDQEACIRVIDAVTEQPIEEAGVLIETDDDSCLDDSLITDEFGECTFIYRDPDKYLCNAIACKEGYRTAMRQDVRLEVFKHDVVVIPLVPLGKANIMVVDSLTNEPLPASTVVIQTADSIASNVQLTTDSSGRCSFYYDSPQSIVNKIIGAHMGYSARLYQNITIESMDSLFIIRLEPMRSCENGVQNSDLSQGGHAVQDYFMGDVDEPVTFRFDYYTNTAPDHIQVYAGSSVDYANGQAQLLWEYNDTTTARSFTNCPSVMINISSPIICVVVDNPSNPHGANSTYWGYFVHCPEFPE